MDMLSQIITKAKALEVLGALHDDSPRGCERVIKAQDIERAFGADSAITFEEYFRRLRNIIKAKQRHKN